MLKLKSIPIIIIPIIVFFLIYLKNEQISFNSNLIYKKNIEETKSNLERLVKKKYNNTIATAMGLKDYSQDLKSQAEYKTELITHFNSISNELAKSNIKTIVLADKSYKEQIIKSFTKKVLKDYYVANINADINLIKYFESLDLARYISNLSTKAYLVEKDLNLLVSYYSLNNSIGENIGHFLIFQSLEDIDQSNIKEVEYFYNLLLLVLTLIFFSFLYLNIAIKEYSLNHINKKIILIFILSFIIVFSIIYVVVDNKYKNDIKAYSNSLLKQSLLEYNSILNSNEALAQLIFKKQLNTEHIKKLFKNKNREVLYEYLKKDYDYLKTTYNIRQMHFHLPDSSSFLRMHRPNKYGDSLKEIRSSVDYVNSMKKPYNGFEEGRIFNGFRYVFPLFDREEYLGSVEASFDIYSIIDSYLESFMVKRVNFLVNKSLVDKKVFKSEKSNYIKSPIPGFYFDKIIIEKLDKLNKTIIPDKKNPKKLQALAQKILNGDPFTVYFKEVNEIVMIIPLVNKINGAIAGSIHVSKDADFIKNRNIEFKQLIIVSFMVLLFIMIFIYKEVVTRIKLNEELIKNQYILDSQKSFIIITNGVEIKISNKSLLDFFGYLSLDEFKKEHDCICDFFEEENTYVRKQMGELNWFEYISKNNNKDNIVKMKDKKGKEHIFYIEFNPSYKLNSTDSIVTFVDITHIKSMEKQLVQNEKMASLGNMIGNIAHQWRQPLSVITTSASTVQVQKELGMLHDENINSAMNTIMEQATFLSQTIDTFRDYIKEEKELRKINIQKEIEKVLKIMDAVLQNNHIKLNNKTSYEKEFYKIMSRGELTQVLTNLINNAKDVLILREIENPTITIECYEKKGNILISIEDNAGGISNDIFNQIFEPYFTTKHQSIGTGLGLYMSHKIIVESIKGKLYVENTNKGAKFYIEIPLDK